MDNILKLDVVTSIKIDGDRLINALHTKYKSKSIDEIMDILLISELKFYTMHNIPFSIKDLSDESYNRLLNFIKNNF